MKKILIAKDLRTLFPEKGSFLDRADLRVFTAATNDEAKGISAREKIDVIVTRLDMPGMRTEDLVQFVRTSPELRQASIIMACQDSLSNRERCKRCRVNAVLTLPVAMGWLFLVAGLRADGERRFGRTSAWLDPRLSAFVELAPGRRIEPGEPVPIYTWEP